MVHRRVADPGVEAAMALDRRAGDALRDALRDEISFLGNRRAVAAPMPAVAPVTITTVRSKRRWALTSVTR
jgi:hypothetical protein